LYTSIRGEFFVSMRPVITSGLAITVMLICLLFQVRQTLTQSYIITVIPQIFHQIGFSKKVTILLQAWR